MTRSAAYIVQNDATAPTAAYCRAEGRVACPCGADPRGLATGYKLVSMLRLVACQVLIAVGALRSELRGLSLQATGGRWSRIDVGTKHPRRGLVFGAALHQASEGMISERRDKPAWSQECKSLTSKA